MKKHLKFLSLIMAIVFTLSGVSLFSAGAEGEYVQPEKFIYGDVDFDGTVTVKDATLIQKGLAKITYVTAVQKYLADPDGTGYSVKNATAIQKYLANYETATPWGEELIMEKENAFSSGIQDKDGYSGKSIMVFLKDNIKYEYTLEDFPEYNFSKVVKLEYEYNKITGYKLYLQDKNKDNVIEALKSLDYRANIDIEHISLTYVSIPT